MEQQRFSVIYHIIGKNEAEAYRQAQDICVEQTVEYPYELLPSGFIKNEIVGKIETFSLLPDAKSYRVEISYAVETTAYELTQLLNVIFGNISLKPGILVERLNLPDCLLDTFSGPRFGRDGLRKILGVYDRPLLFAAIKPMGLSAEQLANIVYQCAVGGMDIIKDDHGLSNQIFAPFEERVRLCSEAVQRANQHTGRNSLYIPNVTGPIDKILERSRFAKKAGAGGLLLAPGLTGLDTLRWLSQDTELALPIFSHPAFQGSYVINAAQGVGLSHYVIYGQLSRLAGADAVVYPNFGGRFSFSMEECQNIVAATQDAMGHLKPIFPAPGGGMTLERIPELMKVYGKEVLFLMGGGLFKPGRSLADNCKAFLALVEQASVEK